jgi:hypothetical protein
MESEEAGLEALAAGLTEEPGRGAQLSTRRSARSGRIQQGPARALGPDQRRSGPRTTAMTRAIWRYDQGERACWGRRLTLPATRK